MKYITNIAVAIALVMVGIASIGFGGACAYAKGVDSVSSVPDKSERPKIVQDDLVSERREASGFDRVSIGGTITATITAGQSFSVTVAARPDVLPKVETKVKDGRLRVGMEDGWWKNRDRKKKTGEIRVTITLPELKDLDVSGASRATVTGINNDTLTIDVSGASDLSIEGNARVIDVDMSGASRMKAENLYSESANMDLSGASSADVNVSTELKVDASGASRVRYSGEPRVQKDTSGSSYVGKN